MSTEGGRRFMKRTCGSDRGGCTYGTVFKEGNVVSGPCKNAGTCLERAREVQHWRRANGYEMKNGKPIKPKKFTGVNPRPFD